MENYIPYGEQWKNELMKLPKVHIISLYRMVCLAMKESEEEVKRLKTLLDQAFPEKEKKENGQKKKEKKNLQEK
jgi:hypothetical protein